MKGRSGIYFVFIFFVYITGFQLKINSQSVIVTDIRLTLLNAGNSPEHAGMIRHLFKDYKFTMLLHDSIRTDIKKKFKVNSVLIDVNSMSFIEGLYSKSYNYKESKLEREGYYVIFESSVGIAEVMRDESYEIMTMIKILDNKKKKVAKEKASVLIENTNDVNKEQKYGQMSEDAFILAYIKSIKMVIGNIKELDVK